MCACWCIRLRHRMMEWHCRSLRMLFMSLELMVTFRSAAGPGPAPLQPVLAASVKFSSSRACLLHA